MRCSSVFRRLRHQRRALSEIPRVFSLAPAAASRCLGGKNDPYFLPAGAEAFRRDLPKADVRLFDTGHFALETYCKEIAKAISDFLNRELRTGSSIVASATPI
jgi:pimeloyl-ACP methyl ester carboxylesterase